MLKKSWYKYHAEVVLKRFYLNACTIDVGFRLRTEKLELHYMSPLFTLGVKVLIESTLCQSTKVVTYL